MAPLTELALNPYEIKIEVFLAFSINMLALLLKVSVLQNND